jgi:hypothetical protein
MQYGQLKNIIGSQKKIKKHYCISLLVFLDNGFSLIWPLYPRRIYTAKTIYRRALRLTIQRRGEHTTKKK